jgi:hypothetical protein
MLSRGRLLVQLAQKRLDLKENRSGLTAAAANRVIDAMPSIVTVDAPTQFLPEEEPTVATEGPTGSAATVSTGFSNKRYTLLIFVIRISGQPHYQSLVLFIDLYACMACMQYCFV